MPTAPVPVPGHTSDTNIELESTKLAPYHQYLPAIQQQRDTHAVANGRKDVGPLNEDSNRRWHATMGKEKRAERGGAGCYGERLAKRASYSDREAQKGLSNPRVSSHLPCTPAACCVALAAAAQTCVCQGRRFRDVAYLILKTTPGTWHANSRTPTHSYVCGS